MGLQARRGFVEGRARGMPTRSSVGAGIPSPTPPSKPKVDVTELEQEIVAEIVDLSELKLRNRAVEDGIDTVTIEIAQGQTDPKEALMILIIEHAKQVANAGGRSRQVTALTDGSQPGDDEMSAQSPGSAPGGIAHRLFGVSKALAEKRTPNSGYEELHTNSSLRDAERKYIPTGEVKGMSISPAEARRRSVSAKAIAETASEQPVERPPEQAMGALARSRALRQELEGLDLDALQEYMKKSEISPAKMLAVEDLSEQRTASK